jgi:hypothetical protein
MKIKLKEKENSEKKVSKEKFVKHKNLTKSCNLIVMVIKLLI